MEKQSARKSTTRRKKKFSKVRRQMQSLDTMDLERMERLRRAYNLEKEVFFT